MKPKKEEMNVLNDLKKKVYNCSSVPFNNKNTTTHQQKSMDPLESKEENNNNTVDTAPTTTIQKQQPSNHQHIGQPSTSVNAEAGRKVGLIAARRTGRIRGEQAKEQEAESSKK